ncbi:DUF7000 family protein [Methanobacterium petrolearium]|uniref:DUF7000 family protein n=1 Tax=Methanobacterium petrolearium TaxID=710190 RepID=UPI003CC90BFE
MKRYKTTNWKLFKEGNWNKYHVPPSIKGMDSIVESVLIEDPDFSDLDVLTEQIETGTLQFIEDVEDFLSKES